MCVLAHPDDESLGTGGTLARYAAEGVETSLITATRGERGRFGDAGEQPGPDVVGTTREAELRAAAQILGIRDLTLLGYPDGALDAVDPKAAQEAIASHLCRVKPDVVITFGPDGAYGHPDHIAISQLTTAAVSRAATMGHTVSKLYYLAWSAATWAAYQDALKTLTATVDGVQRRITPVPDWAITTRIDASAVWQTVWRAVQCHRTQVSVYRHLHELAPDQHQRLWSAQEFYRAFSRVNGGRASESDLFEGVR
jgi:LmbE family N-acetylglucosaminyl deacetylase